MPSTYDRREPGQDAGGLDATAGDTVAARFAAILLLLDEQFSGVRGGLISSTTSEVWAHLLHQAPPTHRARMLRDIGLPAGKRISARLLADLPIRLSRGDALAARALRYLMWVQFDDLVHLAKVGHVRPRVKQVETSEVRALAVVSATTLDTAMPGVLCWLYDNDRGAFEAVIPDVAVQKQLVEFFDTRRSEDPEWPLDPALAAHDHPDDEAEPDWQEYAPDEAPLDAVTDHDLTALEELVEPEEPAEPESDLSAPQPSAADGPGGVNTDDGVTGLRDLLDRGVGACRDTIVRLEKGEPPTSEDVDLLGQVHEAIHSRAAELATQLDRPVDATLAAIEGALADLNKVDERFDLLHRLRAATTPTAQAEDALQAVIASVTGLLETWPPSTAEQELIADALAGLAAFIESTTNPDADDMAAVERFTALSAIMPDEIKPALSAALRGRYALGPADATAPQADAEPAAEASEAEQEENVTSPEAVTDFVGTGIAGEPAAEVQELETAPASRDGSDSAVGPAVTDVDRPATDEPISVVEKVSEAAPASVMSDVTEPAVSITPQAESSALDVGAVRARAAAWLEQGAYALTSCLIAPIDPGVAAAAAVCALATAAHGPNGPIELGLIDLLASTSHDTLLDGDEARLLTLTGLALGTVVTGSVLLGTHLHDLAAHIDAAAQPLVQELADVARTGLLSGSGLSALTEISVDAAHVREAAAACRERSSTGTRSRLPRAAQVLGRIRGPEPGRSGAPITLGGCLDAASSDEREYVTAIAEIMRKHTRQSDLERLIDDDDTHNRAATSTPIEGSVRKEMLAVLRDDTNAIARWVSAVQQLSPSATADYVTTRIDQLRNTILNGQGSLRDLLKGRQNNADPVVAAAAGAALRLLDRISELLTSRSRRLGQEPSPPAVLDLPLLVLPDAGWDSSGAVILDDSLTDPAALAAALLALPQDVRVHDAVAAQVARDDFRSARQVLQLLDPAEQESRAAQLAIQQKERVEQVSAQLRALQKHLSSSQVASDQGRDAADREVTVEVRIGQRLTQQLERTLTQLTQDDPDVVAAVTLLRSARDEVASVQAANQEYLLDQLDKIRRSHDLHEEQVQRIRGRIDAGTLDLAADDLEHLRAGNSHFEPDEHIELPTFLTESAALPNGIDKGLLSAIENGTVHPFLATAAITTHLRADILEGLGSWRELGQQFGKGWRKEWGTTTLPTALRLVGLDVRGGRVDQLEGRSYAYTRNRRFLELGEVSVTGQSLMPAFGSRAGGRYRVLLVWNAPTVEQLDQWRDADESRLPLLVCHFGTLTVEQRLELGRSWNDPTRRPTIVIDDAALAWVATHGRTFDLLMRLTLPFTAAQPYGTEKTPDVPVEMFYGRERERRGLLDPAGPSIVYGGRGLGKSALLSTVERRADESQDNDLVVVWFEVDQITGIDQVPQLLWGELSRKLEAKGVNPPRGASRSNYKDRVEKAVKEWVKQPGKQVLILLDEAEGFFNGDAPNFAEVRSLYQLSNDTASTCKVVFSGLHSVAHYYAAGNIPFSPTGHLQIGPLAPVDAYRLLTKPLGALGYTLTADDAQQILLHCNYQPYLIQMVAHRLLEEQFKVRGDRRIDLAPPPWPVSTTTVKRILNDPNLRQDIKRAFGLTLDLDKRTRVIASVLAVHAHSVQAGGRMLDNDLYNECRKAWPEGFATTTLSSLQELCSELAGLGVLADLDESIPGRTIRNETVLRVLGTREEAQRAIEDAQLNAIPAVQERGQIRPPQGAGSGRRSPLNTAQLGPLFRKGNAVRIIVGTQPGGVREVAPALDQTRPDMVKVRRPGTLAAFRSDIEAGALGGERMLVVSDLAEQTSRVETCERSLALARGDDGVGLPTDRGASRTVVLVADQRNLDWLVEVAKRSELASTVMPLERYTHQTLPLRWRGEDGLDSFADSELRDDVYDVTGGWHVLVERLAEYARRRKATAASCQDAVQGMRSEQAQLSWCQEFLASSGAVLEEWPDMAALVEVLVDYDTPCSPSEVHLLAEGRVGNLETTARLAQWFGLVTVTDKDELVLCELVKRCWRVANPI